MRLRHGINVSVWEDQATRQLKIVFFDDRTDQRRIAEPMELKWKDMDTTKPSSFIDGGPTLALDSHIGTQLLDAISEYCSNSKYRSPNENHLEGKLDATKEHLADMRTLVFEKPKGRDVEGVQ